MCLAAHRLPGLLACRLGVQVAAIHLCLCRRGPATPLVSRMAGCIDLEDLELLDCLGQQSDEELGVESFVKEEPAQEHEQQQQQQQNAEASASHATPPPKRRRKNGTGDPRNLTMADFEASLFDDAFGCKTETGADATAFAEMSVSGRSEELEAGFPQRCVCVCVVSALRVGAVVLGLC